MQTPPPHKKLFHPQSPEELLKGWALHAHKGRDRHDEAARRLDRSHRWLGVLTALFSAIAGTSFFAAQGNQAPASLTGYIAGVIGFMAAILASVQTASNFAGRAEAHRVVGVRYKTIIRKLEFLVSDHSKHGPSCGDKLETALRGIEAELDELESKAPVVPPGVHRYINDQYKDAEFVERVALLNKQVTA